MEKIVEQTTETVKPETQNCEAKNVDKKQDPAPKAEKCCTGCNKDKKPDPKGQELAPEDDPELDIKKYDIFRKYMQSLSSLSDANLKTNRQFKELTRKKRTYWDKQPVHLPHEFDEKIQHDPTEPKKSAVIKQQTAKETSKEKVQLGDAYVWDNCDLNDTEQLDEVYKFLNKNYVEDDDGMFRFDYSTELLKWALQTPGMDPDYLICIRIKASDRMVGFIAGIVVDIKTEGLMKKMLEINFLCVDKMMRTRNFAPLLIAEVARTANTKGIFQAFYTSGQVLPTPYAQARYYHRSLQPKKLIECGFSYLSAKQTMKVHERIHSLPEEPKIQGIRPMRKSDAGTVRNLLNQYGENFVVRQEWSKKEVEHTFMPKNDVMYSYVIESNKVITDFFSFYSLPSSILKHETHKTLRAAYGYYMAAKGNSVRDIMESSCIIAKNEGFDVFNSLDVMHNNQAFEELLFSPGDGYLHYYFWNWTLSTKCCFPKELGLILV